MLSSGLEVFEVRADDPLPLRADPAAPGQPPQGEEIDPDLPNAVDLGDAGRLREREALDRVRNRTGEVSEAHPTGRLELDQLDRAGRTFVWCVATTSPSPLARTSIPERAGLVLR